MEADDASDGDLLRAHGAGDPLAFARLYDRYDRPCFRFIRRILGAAHSEVAEDLHQETWIAVSNNAASFDPAKGGFAAWLYTIARRKVFDHYRRQKVAVLGSTLDGFGEEAMEVPDPDPTPVEHVQSRQQAQAILAAVEALPLEQRSALVLFAGSGLSLEEIAKVTNVAVETAKSRLRYARAKLRLSLAGEKSTHA
jgi:RNA polymerase sigma-70 factor (ECF subfamily)